jgi:steroid 5-alpha reductase family enzyme
MTPPLWGLAFVAGSALVLWLISLKTRDVSIIDIFWAPGIAAVVDIAALLSDASGPRASAALFLVNLWAVRLAAHIFARHDGEDHRYAAMRHKFGARWWWWSLVQVFLLQAILMWFIAAPLVAVMLSSRAPMGVLYYLGV